MSSLNQQLKKGVLEILVLNTISEVDVYGYELLKKLEDSSNGYFKLKEGSLYPIMYRLEDKELIKSYRKEIEGKRGVPRKYYTITENGKRELKDMITEWCEFDDIVSKMLAMK